MWLEYLVVYLDVSHTTVLSIYNSSEDFKSMIGGIVISWRHVCSDGYILNDVSPTTPQLISSMHLSVRMLKQVTASRNRKHIEELLLDKEFKLFSG